MTIFSEYYNIIPDSNYTKKMEGEMNKKFFVAVCTVLIITFLATPAYAFGVKFVSKSLPTTGYVGKTSTFKANIEYDTEIYGIPAPLRGKFHVEVPRLYKLPTFDSGSLSGWNFTAKTGSRTGKAVWEANKGFAVWGTERRSATFKATGSKKGKSQSYIGTGPGTSPAAHEIKSVAVK